MYNCLCPQFTLSDQQRIIAIQVKKYPQTTAEPFNFNNLKYTQIPFVNNQIISMNIFSQKASNFRGSNPFVGKILVGASITSFIVAAFKYFQARGAESQIEFRKRQLMKPIVKLSDEEIINPPWNKNNLDEWLYRRVEVTGRPIHRLACLVPRNVCGQQGFQYVIPLVVKQNEERTQQYGAIFSKGFLPERWKKVGSRYKIENAQRQTFVGFVSTLQELNSPSYFSGNAVQPGRCDYSYANINDFVKTAGFLNKKQSSVAVIERLHEVGDYSQRNPKRYSVDCDFHDDYPYAKTESGALQLAQMPWELKNKAKYYSLFGLASFVVGASVF